MYYTWCGMSIGILWNSLSSLDQRRDFSGKDKDSVKSFLDVTMLKPKEN